MSKYGNKENEKYADIFNALSNPNRLRMFLMFKKLHTDKTYVGSMTDARSCLTEIAEDLNLAPSTVSHHLKELKQAGLIEMERHGKRIKCRVNPAILMDLSMFFLEANKE